MAGGVVARPAPIADRFSRGAERLLRTLGDGRSGLALLLLTGAVNVAAALPPAGPDLLNGWPYAVLLGALALSGVAAVAVRAPAAWREWRRPGPVRAGSGAVVRSVAVRPPEEVAAVLNAAGYRTRLEAGRGRWAIHGVRRGWARFAAQVSHLAVVLVVLGAAIGAAFGSETSFSLFPGDQALLDAPRSGFSSAIRLESFDPDFGTDGRPLRLDTAVTFLGGGRPVDQRVIRVNEPGSFDGYLVHPWTYGPAARVRVTTLDGSALLHAAVPLDGERDGRPVGAAELPTAGVTVGLVLADASANELGVSLVAADGLVDSAQLRPGEEARVGDLLVRLDRFDAWVTFLSRRDPGLGILFGGAALLCASLAVAFWLPRRRLTVRQAGAALELVLRGERFDRPGDEGARLQRLLEGGA